MTKKDLLKRLEKYDDDTMILFGECTEGSLSFGWDNIELIDKCYGSGEVYIFRSGEVEYVNPEELKSLVVGC